MPVCARCGAALDADARVCASCRTLVHADTVERLAGEAAALTSAQRFRESREVWRQALALLPPDTRQAFWIAERIQELDALPAEQPANADAKRPAPNWLLRLGPLGAIALFLLKGKSLVALLFNAKFLLSLGAFVGVYWTLFGAAFGIGFAVSILIHEMGHFIDIRRRGLPADMPVFLPGLGAYVRWQAMGVSLRTRALVSLAGPLAGAIASAACAVVYAQTGSAFWAALGHTSAWLNLLNLIPVPILDGGHATLALNRSDRISLVVGCVVLWMWTGEGALLLVAAGGVWRVFTRDMAGSSDRVVVGYFLGLLLALSGIMHALPDSGTLRP